MMKHEPFPWLSVIIFPDGDEGSDKIDDTLINSFGSKFSEKSNNINSSGWSSDCRNIGVVISRIIYDETSVWASKMKSYRINFKIWYIIILIKYIKVIKVCILYINSE